DRVSSDKIPGTRSLVCHRAKEPWRRRQDQQLDAPARGRRSVDPLQPRSADERTVAVGAGPAAYRSDRRQTETAFRRGREPEATAYSVSRDHQDVDRGAWAAQETNRG